MTLSQATKLEIQHAVESAFKDVQIPSPEGCAIMRNRMEDFSKMLEEHDHFINGNGGDGAKVEMIKLRGDTNLALEKINGRLKTLETFMSDMRGYLKWLLGIAGSAVVLAIINLVLKAP